MEFKGVGGLFSKACVQRSFYLLRAFLMRRFSRSYR